MYVFLALAAPAMLTLVDATGPSSAKQGILIVYDIFGFFPQTLQGADLLAYTDKDRPFQVFMPDFFEGNPADISWYPPDNKEKEQKLGAFFKTAAAPPKTLPRIPKIIEELGKAKGVEKWAILGFCWGGKVTASRDDARNRLQYSSSARLSICRLWRARRSRPQQPATLQ